MRIAGIESPSNGFRLPIDLNERRGVSRRLDDLTQRILRAIVTCSGGRGGATTIQSLRLIPDLDVFVLGIDADLTVADEVIADTFEHVPLPTDSEYIDRIRELIVKYKIDIIYPLAADEVFSLLRHRGDLPCIIPADNLQSLEIASDKGRLYPYLRGHNIDAPRSIVCSSVAELEAALPLLGYPDKRIVVKPRNSAGSRGFHVLDASLDPTRAFTGERPGYPRARWEDVREYLRDPLPELVAMDFLEGIDYTCYALAQNGEPACVLPIRRSGYALSAGLSLGGRIERNDTVIEYVTAICRAFNFHGFVNIQLMVVDGNPIVYEINPRISGMTVACTAAGVNIPYLLYQMFSGQNVRVPDIVWGTHLRRVYEEQYYSPGAKTPLSLSEIVGGFANAGANLF